MRSNGGWPVGRLRRLLCTPKGNAGSVWGSAELFHRLAVLVLNWSWALVRSSLLGDEIIGGETVYPHSMPYMAFLPETKCGGLLIREDIVLTAAHCNGKDMTVLLGAHNIKATEKSVQKIKVCQSAPHPTHKKKANGIDIMLLKLQRTAVPNRYVLPLPLVRSTSVTPGSNCTVAGWGRYQKYDSDLSPELRKLDLKMVSKKECSKAYPSLSITDFICAGNPTTGKFTSNGDSGGPLFCGKDLQGIYHGRNERISTALFTKVSPLLNWIKKTMQTIKCK